MSNAERRRRREVTSARDRSDAAGPTVEELMDIATRFYVRGHSQLEIARSLDRDPSTVSRYLRRARDTGIVRVEIRRPRELADDVAVALGDRFGLERAVVAVSFDDVANAGAEFLGSQLVNGMRIGLSWGRMLSATTHRLPVGIVSNLDISLLHGGVGNAGAGSQGHDLARHMASLYTGSRVTYLHAPVLVDSPDIKQAMVRDGSIKAALDEARARDLALVGIGSLDETAPLIRYGHLTEADRKRLLAAHAVGDMGTRFFNAEGEPVQVLDDRLIAIEWDEMARIPRVVAIAAGPEKNAAVLGALRTGLINTLITDEQTARSVLDGQSDS